MISAATTFPTRFFSKVKKAYKDPEIAVQFMQLLGAKAQKSQLAVNTVRLISQTEMASIDEDEKSEILEILHKLSDSDIQDVYCFLFSQRGFVNFIRTYAASGKDNRIKHEISDLFEKGLQTKNFDPMFILIEKILADSAWEKPEEPKKDSYFYTTKEAVTQKEIEAEFYRIWAHFQLLGD